MYPSSALGEFYPSDVIAQIKAAHPNATLDEWHRLMTAEVELRKHPHRTAAQWCRSDDVFIISPDGWRYNNGMSEFFEKKISKEEFLSKLHQCTTRKGFEQGLEDALRAQYESPIKA